MPTNDDRIERRLTELEVKASFADDLLDELNRLVARHQTQIDRLEREVIELRRQAASVQLGSVADLRDELPPHY